MSGADEQLADCPRCLEACGWCGDYRFMHGKLRLPGSRLYCDLPGLEPEGAACPLCHGSRQVTRVVTYSAAEPVSGSEPFATMRQSDRDISREAIPIPSSREETVDG